jgi:hypothetical protein
MGPRLCLLTAPYTPSPSVESWLGLLCIGSRPSGAFSEVVVSAQELNVFSVDRGAAC